MALERVHTIGVIGFTAEAFCAALTEHGVDVLCDLRARRGVRGREYTFANARRLEPMIAGLGIGYEHFPELSPTEEMRAAQHAVDAAAGVAMRQRAVLAPEFVAGYRDVLNSPEAKDALRRISEIATAPALLCVERLPSACHRSLAAQALAGSTLPVVDIVP
jgi:uncharacterized protein (DUF488 family)